MKAIGRLIIAVIIFLFLAIPCEAFGDRRRGSHEHHHHNNNYRWFGVIPRPQWAPYYGYYVPPAPQYYYAPPPPSFPIGTPMIIGVPPPKESEIIIVPQERQSFEDSQKPIHIPMPQESVPDAQTSVPDSTISKPAIPRDHSLKAD